MSWTKTTSAAVMTAAAIALAGCSAKTCKAVDSNGWPIVPAGPVPASYLVCYKVPNQAYAKGYYMAVDMPHAVPAGAEQLSLDECVNPDLKGGGSRGSAQ